METVSKEANVYTDEYLGYHKIADMYNHQIVHHAEHEFARGKVTTNTIESFWAIIKRGLMGIYHSWSKKHLQKYVDEFVFRYNTRTCTDRERFDLLLNNCRVRTTYKELING